MQNTSHIWLKLFRLDHKALAVASQSAAKGSRGHSCAASKATIESLLVVSCAKMDQDGLSTMYAKSLLDGARCSIRRLLLNFQVLKPHPRNG